MTLAAQHVGLSIGALITPDLLGYSCVMLWVYPTDGKIDLSESNGNSYVGRWLHREPALLLGLLRERCEPKMLGDSFFVLTPKGLFGWARLMPHEILVLSPGDEVLR